MGYLKKFIVGGSLLQFTDYLKHILLELLRIAERWLAVKANCWHPRSQITEIFDIWSAFFFAFVWFATVSYRNQKPSATLKNGVIIR